MRPKANGRTASRTLDARTCSPKRNAPANALRPQPMQPRSATHRANAILPCMSRKPCGVRPYLAVGRTTFVELASLDANGGEDASGRYGGGGCEIQSRFMYGSYVNGSNSG